MAGAGYGDYAAPVTILLPVRQRLSAARLYAVLVPAPFTPPDALLRRVEDLVVGGVDVVQFALDGWDRRDALALLERCHGVTVPTGRLVVVAHDPELAVSLGADVLLLASEQNLPLGLGDRLGPQAAIGREVGEPAQLREGFEDDRLSFLVLAGDRAADLATAAHRLAPLAAPDAYADPVGRARPWFVDLGERWTDPPALPERACRVRFEVFVPADSPAEAPSVPLRSDVAELAARVGRRWDEDPGLTALRERVLAENAVASTGFRSARRGASPTVTRDAHEDGGERGRSRDAARDGRTGGSRRRLGDLLGRALRRGSRQEPRPQD